jgi:hypothetical protein
MLIMIVNYVCHIHSINNYSKYSYTLSDFYQLSTVYNVFTINIKKYFI